ncbi:MAG TPA: hypothetical protein VJM83_06390 [Nitrospirota bacterium]|nr:hypothetical protein [Nitrospirota bacterium]
MKTKTLDNTEIRIKGIETLNEVLGPSAALKFFDMVRLEPTDYVEVSKRLYKGQTVEDIFARAKKHWKG